MRGIKGFTMSRGICSPYSILLSFRNLCYCTTLLMQISYYFLLLEISIIYQKCYIWNKVGSFVAQVFRVRVSITPCGFRGERNGVLVGFLPFSPATNFIPPFPHTLLIHFVSYNFIRPCDDASGVVGRHPCYSQTFKFASHPSTRSCVAHELIFFI